MTMPEVLEPAVEVGSQLANVNNGNNSNNSSTSSTQIIESLYNKVDSLTNTNLQLTLQSQNMLEKLDVAQKKEVKLVENISMYKHQRDNLDTMLRRKLRKISELEEELGSLQMTFASVRTTNKELEDVLIGLKDKEESDKKKLTTLTQDYDSLVQSQDSYRVHFHGSMDRLSQEMVAVKIQYINKLTRRIQNADSLELKLNKYKKLIDKLERTGTLRDVSKVLKDETCRDILKKLDLKSWILLYKLSGKVIDIYADKNQLDLTRLKGSQSILHDPDIDLIAKDVRDKISIKKRNTSTRNTYSPIMYSTSPMMSTASSRIASGSPRIGGMIPPSRTALRTIHSPQLNSKPDSTLTSSPALPGVRRISSVHNNVYTDHNNSQSNIHSNSKTESTASMDHRRKRNSVIYN